MDEALLGAGGGGRKEAVKVNIVIPEHSGKHCFLRLSLGTREGREVISAVRNEYSYCTYLQVSSGLTSILPVIKGYSVIPKTG